MPQIKRRSDHETFGQRVARLRKARGLTQRDLGQKVGLSYRMVAYYEGQTDRPPAHVLPELARVLDVTVDELLGLGRLPSQPVDFDVRIWRRMQRIQQMSPSARQTVLKLLDSLIKQYGSDRGVKT